MQISTQKLCPNPGTLSIQQKLALAQDVGITLAILNVNIYQ